MKRCPCSSGLAYADCCLPLHEGQLPASAEALMRSRYSAYALGLVDYIIETTHPAFRQSPRDQWRAQIQDFCENTRFTGLGVLDVQQQGSQATVRFRAGLRQGKQDASFTELSRFEKVVGRWLYQEALQ